MAYDRFLIAPIGTGLQTDLRPWLIPDDAFQQMNNAYVFRGRITKRFGSVLTGVFPSLNSARLRIDTGVMTDGSGNYGPAVPTNINSTITAAAGIGAYFLVGTTIYTVHQAAGATLANGTGTATFTISTGSLQIVGGPASTEIYYYPGLPVMGLGLYENGPINNQPAVAFDTKNPYEFSGSNWEYLSGATTTPLFTGTDNDYFWTTTYRGTTASTPVLFVSNNVDPIWYYDGNDWNFFSRGDGIAITGVSYFPVFDTAGDLIKSARIVLPYKDRLVLLNTTEIISGTPTNYNNRARWSSIGNPLALNAWLTPSQSWTDTVTSITYNPIGGGIKDAATEEAIVGAEFIKDRLIVYFETSTWELAYTGNQVQPFVWQKINTELGAVGTFSTIPFDKAVLGIGKTGVHACSGANVQRIDQKIPDEVFNFKVKNNAYNRINGIRVYQPELAVWSYVEESTQGLSGYANKQIIYNYENETWSFNDDTIMCYGFFEQQSDLLWQDATFAWQEASFTWTSNVIPAESRQVIMGNAEGTISILRPDTPSNSASLLVNNVTNTGNSWTFYVRNHNFGAGDFVYFVSFSTVDSIAFANDGIFQIYSVTIDSFTIISTQIAYNPPATFYNGKLTVASVSRVDIISKQWNPYVKDGFGIYLAKIVFAVATVQGASIQVDYNPDDSNDTFVADSGPAGTNSLIGTSILDMYPYTGFDTQGAERLWHPVYFQGQGNCVQIRMYYNDDQMVEASTALSNIEVQGLMLFTMRGVIRFA